MGQLPKVVFYEVAFITGLRLPFSHLYHWLADFMADANLNRHTLRRNK